MLMTNNKKILYLVGQNNINKKPLIPFNKTVCEFLNDLSKKLSTDKKILNYTDVKAFSFWCRKGNIEKYKKQFEDGKFRLGLGLAFHITPSNIPTNFAYSFTFGLLAGNANIVRIPTNNYPQVDIICNAIKSLFNKKKYQQIKKMNAFVKYEKNDESDKQTKLENSRLVLFSVAGEAAFEHYENTILKDVSTNNFQTSEMKKLPNVRMWGANDRSTNHNRSKWSKLKKGDILLFYKDKKYVAQMTISGTEDNYDVAKMIWGEKIDHDTMNVESKSGETWQLIMYAEPDNVKQTNVKMGDLNNLLDYKENFMPTRTLDFMPVNESKLQQLQNQYGSIQNALDSIDL